MSVVIGDGLGSVAATEDLTREVSNLLEVLLLADKGVTDIAIIVALYDEASAGLGVSVSVVGVK